MEDFDGDKKAKKPKDTYQQNLDKILGVKRSVNLIESSYKDNFGFSGMSATETKKKVASDRALLRANMWIFGAFVITANINNYKLLVKFYRKINIFKGYWSINFAILGPMMLFNMACLGLMDGLYQSNVTQKWITNIPLTPEEEKEFEKYKADIF